jgi:hypothetical protein
VARWGTTSQHIEKMFNLFICGYIKLNFKDAYMIKTSHLLVIFEILCHPPDTRVHVASRVDQILYVRIRNLMYGRGDCLGYFVNLERL